MIEYDKLPNTSLDTLIETMNIFTKHTIPAFDDLNFVEKKKRISRLCSFESLDFIEWGFLKSGKYVDILGVRFFLKIVKGNLYAPLHIKLDDKVSTIPALKELIKIYDPYVIYNIYTDEVGFNDYFDVDYNKDYLTGAYYDETLITLQGKKYANLRVQRNRLNADIEAGLIRMEQIPLSEMTLKHTEDLKALITKWIGIKNTWNEGKEIAKPNTNHAFRYINFMQDLIKKDKIKLFDMIVITMIYDNEKGNCISFGISELSNNLVNCNIDSKVDYEYKDRYPDLGKLINHYTAKQIVEHLNLDPSKVTHTLAAEWDNKPQFASLLSYKINNVAYSHTLRIVKYLKSGRDTCRIKNPAGHKRSIF